MPPIMVVANARRVEIKVNDIAAADRAPNRNNVRAVSAGHAHCAVYAETCRANLCDPGLADKVCATKWTGKDLICPTFRSEVTLA